MNITIRAMIADDYPAVAELWHRTEGIGLNESDTKDAIAVYLQRNPGMSAVGQSEGGIVLGAVLCGHDGRRGYLHHLAVDPAHRHQGIAKRLLKWSFERLREASVPKCNIFLFSDNESGAAFWNGNGWSSRPDLVVFQKATSQNG